MQNIYKEINRYALPYGIKFNQKIINGSLRIIYLVYCRLSILFLYSIKLNKMHICLLQDIINIHFYFILFDYYFLVISTNTHATSVICIYKVIVNFRN